MANHLHQLVIAMEAGFYTIYNGVWGRSPQRPEARGSGGRSPQRLAIFGRLLPK